VILLDPCARCGARVVGPPVRAWPDVAGPGDEENPTPIGDPPDDDGGTWDDDDEDDDDEGDLDDDLSPAAPVLRRSIASGAIPRQNGIRLTV
jgi:hypothetical protein